MRLPRFFYPCYQGTASDTARDQDMDTNIALEVPFWVLLLDYALGAAMWTLVGRFGMSIFLPDNSPFFFMRMFVWITDPMIRAMKFATPGFLVQRLVPLYVAWFIFMVRFYLLPLALGYSVMGVLSFPLEGEIARFIWNIGGPFR